VTDGKLHQDVGRIEGKVDLIIGLLERGASRMDEHGDRIATLERNMSWRSRVSALLGAIIGGVGIHLAKVIVASVALSALLVSPAPGAAAPKTALVKTGVNALSSSVKTGVNALSVIDARRAAIVKAVASIGVYPGAELTILGSTYLIEAVEVSADYVVTIRTRLLRSSD
jgi:hypothetical protein